MNNLLERFISAVERIATALEAKDSIAAKAPAAASDTKAPATEKPAKTPAKPKPEPAFPKAPEIETASPPKPGAPAFPYEQLKKAIIDLAQIGKEGRDAAVDLLARFGVKKASDANPSQWEEMYDKARSELTRLTTKDDADFA